MEFGMCGGFDRAEMAADCGFDYIEMGVQGLLDSNNPDDSVFKENMQKLQAMPLPCKALNCLLPGSIPVVGPAVSPAQYREYIDRVMERAGQAGIKTIVFGSGGCRKCPEGFSKDTAWQQIREFGRYCAEKAYENGVTVVLEPLNVTETNTLNDVATCGKMVRDIDHPGMRLLVDGYHWGRDNEAPGGILEYGSLLCHAHIATWPNRLAPGMEDCELDSFFAPLLNTGYDATISFEGKVDEDPKMMRRALDIMRQSVAALRPNCCSESK